MLPAVSNSYAPSPLPVAQDIWHDAQEGPCVILADILNSQETDVWYDAQEGGSATHALAAFADARIPFTEDCGRCLRQLIGLAGEYGQGQLYTVLLNSLLPDIPADILCAANSLWRALTRGEHPDIAALQTLGLVSRCLPGSLLSGMAAFIRDTVFGWAGVRGASRTVYAPRPPWWPHA